MRKRILLVLLTVALYSSSIAPVSALSIAVHVPEKYTDVEAGERFYFEIDVKYPENDSRKDLRLNYEILKDNEVIAQSQVLKAIETQASFVDFIVIPKSTEQGMHTIKIKVSDYEGLSEEASASFQVIAGASSQIETYLLILIGLVAVVTLLVVINMFRGRKS